MSAAHTKGEGVVTAPWRVAADHAAAARFGCRPTPFQPKGGTRAERRLIIRRVLLAVIPGWLPNFERLEPECEPGLVMTLSDLAPKKEEIDAEPIRVTEAPRMSDILRRALEAKRALERAVLRTVQPASAPKFVKFRSAASPYIAEAFRDVPVPT